MKSEAFDKIISCIDNIKSYSQDFPQAKLIFLEIAVSSIKPYNESKRYHDPKTFGQQHETRALQIWQVNEKLRAVNHTLSTRSPNFYFFLQSRKQHRTRPRVETWDNFNDNLYRDGI